jgi:hypothetical protein
MNPLKMAAAAPLLVLAACAGHAEQPRHVADSSMPAERIYLPALSQPMDGAVKVTYRRGAHSGDASSLCNVGFDGQLYATLGRNEKASLWLAPGHHVFTVAASGNPNVTPAPQVTDYDLAPGEPLTMHVEWTSSGPLLQPVVR